MSKAIKVIRNTVASGQSVYAGSVYAVPDEISEADARDLMKLGKAVPADSTRKAKADKGEEK